MFSLPISVFGPRFISFHRRYRGLFCRSIPCATILHSEPFRRRVFTLSWRRRRRRCAASPSPTPSTRTLSNLVLLFFSFSGSFLLRQSLFLLNNLISCSISLAASSGEAMSDQLSRASSTGSVSSAVTPQLQGPLSPSHCCISLSNLNLSIDLFAGDSLNPFF